MVFVLELITYIMVLFFGILLTVSFSGGCNTKRERLIIGILAMAILFAQILCWQIFGFTATKKLYPLISHLPIILTLVFALKKPLGVTVASLLTAYFCCQLPRWVATISLAVFGTQLAYLLIYIIVIVPIFFLLKRYFAASANKAMSYSRKSLLLFGGLPLFYYIFDYITTVYTSALYEGIKMVSEFLPASMALFYVMFVTIYHNEVQQRTNIEIENSMLSMQFEQAKNDIFTLQQIQEQTATYRHDMRHHFTMIIGYLQSRDPEKAIMYIKSAKHDIDRITPKRYCENTVINLVLSAFSDKGEKLGVALNVESNIPNMLPISETALCTLFSNGIENAVFAAANISDEKQKTVRVNCQIHKGNLLIYIKNPYQGEITFEDNLPKSNHPEHGFGVKSIKLITDMHGGFCSFKAQNGIFTLKVALPLEH